MGHIVNVPDPIHLAPGVAEALRDGQPVVALESALISHSLSYPTAEELAGDPLRRIRPRCR